MSADRSELAAAVARLNSALSATPPLGHSATSPPALTATPLSQLHHRPIDWLWSARLPRAHVSLLLGPPDSGKTTLALDLAARLASGAPLPPAPGGRDRLEGGSATGQDEAAFSSPHSAISPLCHSAPSSVFLLPDPSLTHSLHLRLAPLPADSTANIRLLLPTPSIPRSLDLSIPSASIPRSLDPLIPSLSSSLSSSPHTSLLIIDPLPTLHTNSRRSLNSLRSTLSRLADLAATHNIAILALATLPTARAVPTASAAAFLLASLPSIPCASLLTRDPLIPNRRILIPIRSALAPRPPALAFSLPTTPGRGTGLPPGVLPTPGPIDWEPAPADDSNNPADPFAASSIEPRELADAAEWLRDLLSRGPMPAANIPHLAREDGFAYRTIERAKHRLRVRSLRHGHGPAGVWKWQLPTVPETPSPAPEPR